MGVNIKDAFDLATKGLRNRKLRSALTMIGIFIGIAAVVSLIALGEGMRDAITGQFSSLGTDKVTIQASTGGFGPPGTSVVNKLQIDDVKLVESARGVKIATRRMVRSLQYEFNDEVVFEFGVSLPEDPQGAELILNALNYKAEHGRILKKGDNNKIVVGSDYATNSIFSKPLDVGDKILVDGKQVEVAKGMIGRSSSAKSRSSRMSRRMVSAKLVNLIMI